MGGRPVLTLRMATEIKGMLWSDINPQVIADKFFITKSYVSTIKYGHSWEEAKWPDGSAGGLSKEQVRMIREATLERRADIQRRLIRLNTPEADNLANPMPRSNPTYDAHWEKPYEQRMREYDGLPPVTDDTPMADENIKEHD